MKTKLFLILAVLPITLASAATPGAADRVWIATCVDQIKHEKALRGVADAADAAKKAKQIMDAMSAFYAPPAKKEDTEAA